MGAAAARACRLDDPAPSSCPLHADPDRRRLVRHPPHPRARRGQHRGAAAARHAAGVVAGAHALALEGRGGGGGRVAAGAAADGDRLLPAGGDGPERAARPAHRGARPRPLAVLLCRPGGGLGGLLAALRRAAARQRLRGHRPPPAGGRRHAARRALGPLLQRRTAAGAAGLRHRHHPRLRPHRGRVRRGADDRRQHPRQDAGGLGGDLRPRRGAGVRPGALAVGRHAGVQLRGAARALRPAGGNAGGGVG